MMEKMKSNVSTYSAAAGDPAGDIVSYLIEPRNQGMEYIGIHGINNNTIPDFLARITDTFSENFVCTWFWPFIMPARRRAPRDYQELVLGNVLCKAWEI